ncbi:TPA: cyclase [Candidatus Dependentiae bacterium]|nr:MAG: hypothetical protein A2Y17_09890 [Clostridiales bacterium GWF2_38_85]HBL98986.1 cyclase [Candidatus Dependentiae bacterium]
MSSLRLIDLTHTITPVMPVYPGDEPASLIKTHTLEKDHYNNFTLSSSMHVGTHIDGPGHLTTSPLLLSNLPINSFIGKGVLIDARNKAIEAPLFENIPREENLIVLVMTGFDKQYGTPEYFTTHPVLLPNAAEKIAEKRVKMIGLDFPSPDHYPFERHKTLFAANVLIIENLTNLERLLNIPDFTIIALPLKTETDSALARVIAVYTEP